MTFDLTAEEASGVATLTELLEDLVVPVGRRTRGLFLGGFLSCHGGGWAPPPRSATVEEE